MASVKRCGHMGGRCWCHPRSGGEADRGAPGRRRDGRAHLIVARTDARSRRPADLHDVDDNDKPFCTGDAPSRASTRRRMASTRRSAAAWPMPRRPGLVQRPASRPGFAHQVRESDPSQVPGQAAGLQLLAQLQLEEEPRRRDDRQVPEELRGDGLQVPVHHPGPASIAELRHVRPRRTAFAPPPDERVRRVGRGVRRRPRLPRSSTSARWAPATSMRSPDDPGRAVVDHWR